MTLKITILHDQPNYSKDAMVQCIHPKTKLCTSADHRLRPGESVTLYVHDGQQVVVTEVAPVQTPQGGGGGGPVEPK